MPLDPTNIPHSSHRASRKIYIVLGLVFCGLSLTSLLLPVRAFENGSDIRPGEYVVFSIGLEKGKQNVMDVHANESWNVLILAGDNFTAFIDDLPCETVFNLTKTGDYYTTFDPFMFNLTLILVVRNVGTTILRINVKINETSQFVTTLRYSMRFLIIGAFLTLALFFMRRKRELERTEEHDQAEVYSGFFWTYLFVAFNFLQSEATAWLRRDALINVYPELNLAGAIHFRLDQLVFIILIIVSDLFMTRAIEKRVGHFKHLYLTHLLESAAIALILTPFLQSVPVLIDILTIYTLGVMIITFGRIFYLYLRIAWDSSGAVRMKSLAIGVGLILPLVTLLVGGNLTPSYPDISNIIMDGLTVFSTYLLYRGLQ